MKKGTFYMIGLLLLFLMSAFFVQEASANTQISWIITCCGSEPYVHYSYTFTYPKKDPSYFILEASGDLTTSDITNVTVDGMAVPFQLNWFIPDRDDQGGQYQTMPEKIWGIKINIPECQSIPCGSVTMEFDSTRLPVWGDFYMRDGVSYYQETGIKEWNSAYNQGFQNPDNNLNTADDQDPSGAPSNGSVNNHILVPDTLHSASPSSSSSYAYPSRSPEECYTYTGSLSTDGSGDGFLHGTGDWQGGPTYVSLAYFSATPSDSSVLLQWETELEVDNAGFNIWRGEVGGPHVRVNEFLIPATGSGSYYEFADSSAANGIEYTYYLEDIDLYGISMYHGPVTAMPDTIVLLSPGNNLVLSATVVPTFQWASDKYAFFKIVFQGVNSVWNPIKGWTENSTYTPSAADWRKFSYKLPAGQVFYWQVLGVDKKGNKAVSESRSFAVE